MSSLSVRDSTRVAVIWPPAEIVMAPSWAETSSSVMLSASSTRISPVPLTEVISRATCVSRSIPVCALMVRRSSATTSAASAPSWEIAPDAVVRVMLPAVAINCRTSRPSASSTRRFPVFVEAMRLSTCVSMSTPVWATTVRRPPATISAAASPSSVREPVPVLRETSPCGALTRSARSPSTSSTRMLPVVVEASRRAICVSRSMPAALVTLRRSCATTSAAGSPSSVMASACAVRVTLPCGAFSRPTWMALSSSTRMLPESLAEALSELTWVSRSTPAVEFAVRTPPSTSAAPSLFSVMAPL